MRKSKNKWFHRCSLEMIGVASVLTAAGGFGEKQRRPVTTANARRHLDSHGQKKWIATPLVRHLIIWARDLADNQDQRDSSL